MTIQHFMNFPGKCFVSIKFRTNAGGVMFIESAGYYFIIPSLCIYSLVLYQKGVRILTVCAGISFTPKAYLSLFHQAVNQTRIIVVPRKLFENV